MNETKVAELSNAISVYQKTEELSDVNMLMIIQEIAQMYTRKIYLVLK